MSAKFPNGGAAGPFFIWKSTAKCDRDIRRLHIRNIEVNKGILVYTYVIKIHRVTVQVS